MVQLVTVMEAMTKRGKAGERGPVARLQWREVLRATTFSSFLPLVLVVLF